jgi:hypothetical protein
VLAVAGTVVVVASSDVGRIIGWGLVALAITLAISLVFLEVGYSEDRERARQARRRDNGVGRS